MPNNKALHIRTYKPKDITDLSVLLYRLIINQSSRDSYNNSETKDLSKAEIKKYFENCLNNPDCFIFVAEHKCNLIGFAEMWLRRKDFFFGNEDYAYILNGFVDKEIKLNINPLSVPLKLFQACEDKAIELGYKYIGGDVFEFNTQMKILLKLYNVQPYRTRYMKRLTADE